jgi:hypothetical protein
MAALLLMAAMGVTVRTVGWVARERRGADRRTWAVQEASNVMERLTAEPFGRVTTARARELAAASAAARVLPGASWEVEVADEPDTPVPTRRVSLRLRWTDRSGGLDAPVRLTAWVFGRGGPS